MHALFLPLSMEYDLLTNLPQRVCLTVHLISYTFTEDMYRATVNISFIVTR